MTRLCPEGHESASEDYCDVCGSPMGAPSTESPSSTPPPVPRPASAPAPLDLPPSAALQECPNCGIRNRESNLFCEACGYDFTTGVMPRPVELAEGSFLDLDAGRPAAPEPAGTADGGRDAVSATQEADGTSLTPGAKAGGGSEAIAAPAARAGPEPGVQPEPDAESGPDAEPAPVGGPVGVSEGPVPPPAPTQPGPRPGDESDSARSTRRPRYVPPSRDLGDAWVVEVWVDPAWYAAQDSDEEAPSPGVPDIVPLSSTTALIGRPSASRNVRPEVDCGSDIGVSRRQAALTSDGRRWWIEDLDSANGTFIGPAAGPLPASPLPPGRRVEIDFDDRIYVGAWTRLVVRRATASERVGHG